MRHTLFLLSTIVLISSFASTSFAKDRDRDNRHDKKIHVVEQVVQDRHYDRHHGDNYRSERHHQKQLKVAKQQRRIEKQQRKIIKQQRKIAKLQQRRHQQRWDNRYSYSNQRRMDHREYKRWASNDYKPLRHDQPRVMIPIPLPPLPRIVLHFPW